jgi:hypothetical protein
MSDYRYVGLDARKSCRSHLFLHAQLDIALCCSAHSAIVATVIHPATGNVVGERGGRAAVGEHFIRLMAKRKQSLA